MDRVKEKLEEWKMIRGLTLDLLGSLTEEQLGMTVGEKMGSIGKQFRHIGDVEHCYIEAIKTGKCDFGKYLRKYDLEGSVEGLKGFLEEMDEKLEAAVAENPEAKIDWFGEETSLEAHLNNLIGHEILHQGELVVYCRSEGIEFPQSWKDYWAVQINGWGKGNEKKDE